MKKIYINLFAIALLCLGFNSQIQAQCAAGQTEITAFLPNQGSYGYEIEWTLTYTVGGVSTTSDPQMDISVLTVCVDNGTAVVMEGCDSYGDGWNGATVQMDITEDESANGGSCGQDGCVVVEVGSATTSGVVQCPATTTLFNVIIGGNSGCTAISGCTDPLASNYNSCATVSDGSCILPPANDNCAQAQPLTCNGPLVSGTTVGAVAETNPIGCNSDYGVWYSFTGIDGLTTVTSPSTFDHALAIFTSDAGCGGTFTQVACQDGSTATESVEISTILGETYYVYVAHYSTSSSTTGTFDISISCTSCIAPTLVLNQGGDNCPADEFYINATMADLGNVGTVDISVDGVVIYADVMVTLDPYVLGPFPGGTSVTVVAGDATCNTSASLTTPASCPPVNDVCASAIPITPDNTAVVSGSTVAATTTGAPSDGTTACNAASDPGVWYAYTSSAPETVTIDFCANSDFDVDLIVMYSPTGDCSALTCIGYQDAGPNCGFPDYRPEYTFDTGDYGVTSAGPNQSAAPVTFYFYVHGFNGATGNYGFVFPQTLLPVELVAFEGEVMDEGNKLSWATATEFGSEFHVIERSLDDARTWTEIGRVDAAGESSERTNYEFMDENPTAKSLYRLVSIDYSRAQSISSIVSLERQSSGFGITTTFPNPTKDRVMVQYHSDSNTSVDVEITNITGQVVQRITTEGQDGVNSLDLDFTELSAGTYFIRLSNDYEFVTERIIKQ